MNSKTMWTIGHSNRKASDFSAILQSFDIRNLVDVRRFPGSRRQTQFQQENLRNSLEADGIEYHHFERLGGRRHHRSNNSPNGAWRVESFNAYADYMLTDEFHSALSDLKKLAGQERTAIMCAEAVPWRCHRRLIADALTIRRWTVRDIFAESRDQVHQLTKFARINGMQLTYPESALDQEDRDSAT